MRWYREKCGWRLGLYGVGGVFLVGSGRGLESVLQYMLLCGLVVGVRAVSSRFLLGKADPWNELRLCKCAQIDRTIVVGFAFNRVVNVCLFAGIRVWVIAHF